MITGIHLRKLVGGTISSAGTLWILMLLCSLNFILFTRCLFEDYYFILTFSPFVVFGYILGKQAVYQRSYISRFLRNYKLIYPLTVFYMYIIYLVTFVPHFLIFILLPLTPIFSYFIICFGGGLTHIREVFYYW